MQPSDEDHFPFRKHLHHDVGRRHLRPEQKENVHDVGQNRHGVSDGERSEIDPLVAHQRSGAFAGWRKPHHQPKRENVDAGKPKKDVDKSHHVTTHPSP